MLLHGRLKAALVAMCEAVELAAAATSKTWSGSFVHSDVEYFYKLVYLCQVF
jgi:hypothetical protein